MATPDKAIEIARSYVGTPYHPHARLKGVGIDCVGLLICVARECGADLPDQQGYQMMDQGNVLEATFIKLGMGKLPAIVPGAVLAFRFGRSRHAGLCTVPGRMIHVDSRIGRVTEVGVGLFERLFDSAWALPGVSY